jgi:hypothetical protein
VRRISEAAFLNTEQRARSVCLSEGRASAFAFASCCSHRRIVAASVARHGDNLIDIAAVKTGLPCAYDREHAMSKQINIDRLFDGRHFDREVMVLCVRWYLVSNWPISGWGGVARGRVQWRDF